MNKEIKIKRKCFAMIYDVGKVEWVLFWRLIIGKFHKPLKYWCWYEVDPHRKIIYLWGRFFIAKI